MNFGNVNFKTFVVCEFLVASTALSNSWCRGKDFNGWFFSTLFRLVWDVALGHRLVFQYLFCGGGQL